AVGVHVGGVHKRAPAVEEGFELVARVRLVGLPAPGHRAQTKAGHAQSGPPQMSLLHSCECSGWGRSVAEPSPRRLWTSTAHRPFGGSLRPPSTSLLPASRVIPDTIDQKRSCDEAGREP